MTMLKALSFALAPVQNPPTSDKSPEGDIIMSLQSRLDIICDEADGDVVQLMMVAKKQMMRYPLENLFPSLSCTY
ncbi:hypothetical protein CK203_092234 [Vitis vinifera]|uniref:Uncharacterized protein n=1 Tax=Vitis vinifera TaxID=29760 RepID=A0A438F8C2_VITVI|nr:hypothetical protein CK203_092234 [Vitis vinifera]